MPFLEHHHPSSASLARHYSVTAFQCLVILISTAMLWSPVAAVPVSRIYKAPRLAPRNNTQPSPYCGSDDEATIFTSGDIDSGGPGILLKDADYTNLRQRHYYFLYENGRDDHPWKYILLTPGAEVFISVCPTFSGRLVRGNPDENLDGTGDVSLLQGCDGAAVIAATDGSGIIAGFSLEIVLEAPASALTNKTDGSPALAKTVGDFANNDTRDYELSLLNPVSQAFVVENFKPVVATQNGRWQVIMYAGTY